MKAITKFLAGGVAMAALAGAAPAAAQYYPGYGYGGNVVGQVLGQVLGGGYGYGNNGYGNYGVNSQAAVNQCASVVQARLGGNNGYGYNNSAYGGGRVLGISRVEPRNNGGLTVRGVATSGRYAGAYGGQAPVDLTWRCKVDYRGFISDIDVNRTQANYGGYNYNNAPYGNGYNYNNVPYGNGYDYSQYGYRRY
jgi:hypothetical protein